MDISHLHVVNESQSILSPNTRLAGYCGARALQPDFSGCQFQSLTWVSSHCTDPRPASGGGLSASLGQRLTCTLQTECHLGDRISRNALECQSLSGDTENSSLHSSEEWSMNRSFGSLVSDNLYSLTQTPLKLRLSPGHKLR